MPVRVAGDGATQRNGATYPYVLALASGGLTASVGRDSALAKGVNTFESQVTYQVVAEALGLDYVPVEKALAA